MFRHRTGDSVLHWCRKLMTAWNVSDYVWQMAGTRPWHPFKPNAEAELLRARGSVLSPTYAFLKITSLYPTYVDSNNNTGLQIEPCAPRHNNKKTLRTCVNECLCLSKWIVQAPRTRGLMSSCCWQRSRCWGGVVNPQMTFPKTWNLVCFSTGFYSLKISTYSVMIEIHRAHVMITF